MSVVSVQEHPESGSGSREVTDRTYTRRLLVRCSSRTDEAKVVLENPAIPTLGSLYVLGTSDDQNCYCTSVKCDLVENTVSGRLFSVTCEYKANLSQNDLENLREDGVPNPLTFPPRIASGGTVEFLTTPLKDINGVDIKNTAGDLFVDAPQASRAFYRVSIVRNEYPLNLNLYGNTIYKVNSVAWQTGAKRTWLCESITHSNLLYQGPYPYYEVTYSFAYKGETWDVEILNAGMRINNGGTLQTAKDKNGNEITSPMALNQAGTALLGPTASGIYLSFKYYKETDFNGLGLNGAL